MGDRTRGLYPEGKFRVFRRDREHEPGGKHVGCDYFVLDLTHDPHSIPAVRAYADSCEKDGYGLLAADLRAKLPALPISPDTGGALGSRFHFDDRWPEEKRKAVEEIRRSERRQGNPRIGDDAGPGKVGEK